MEVYVDDMLVKSRTTQQLAFDLREVLEILRQSRETKWVRSGKFLGYMVSKNGMEANPDKVKAILDMSPPKTIKEVQRLTGRMAALNRFLSKSAERGLPFFNVLNQN